MALGFFKDRGKGPREICCPLCNHRQQESRLAVSSCCKGCNAYLSFKKDGSVEARPAEAPNPFANRPKQPKVEIDPHPPKKPPISLPAKEPLLPPKEPLLPPKPIPKEAPEPIVPTLPSSAPSTKAPPAPTPPAQAPTPLPVDHRYHGQDKQENTSKAKMETRIVTCFECGDSHPANLKANSTQCRACGRLISLEDREIKQAWASAIQTKGDVHIHKKGNVGRVPIQCHHLTVEGIFMGDAECSGDLILRRPGKIEGKVTCKRLLIERRAKIEFANEVLTEECKIDGLVTGNLVCRGLLALEKRATLTGDIKVGRLTVADGAKHSGQIQMGGF